MNKSKVKKRIEDRFRKKPKGELRLRFKSGSKLIIEYMYGARYSVKRLDKGNETLLEMVATSDRVVELIMKEKTKQLFNKFK